jgi:hypothetical protein
MPYFINKDHRLHYRETGVGDAVFIIPGTTASSASHEGELAYFGKTVEQYPCIYGGQVVQIEWKYGKMAGG